MNITNYGESGPRLLQMGDPGSSQLREGDFIADRELALTSDARVVEERDKDALFLLVAKGQVVAREVAAKHSLRLENGRAAWGPAAPAAESVPESEALEIVVTEQAEPVLMPVPAKAEKPAQHTRRRR